MKRTYDVARNTENGKWYVIGYCGRSRLTGRQEWMAISNSFNNKTDAIAAMKKQYQTDKSAIAELSTI